MTDLSNDIEELVERHLENESLFVVDIVITGNQEHSKVLIVLDGDEGVSINECAQISRKVGADIEEEELITGKYNLEVTSPGLDQPFKLKRQYVKNIGREVRVILNDGSEKEGKLEAVEEKELVLRERMITKNKSIKQYKKDTMALDFDQVLKTNIILSF